MELQFDAMTAALAIGAGFFAGLVNTIAGSGSLITLPVLVFLGLPADVANGTNRVGVALQSATSLATLRQRDALVLQGAPTFAVPTIMGALLGAALATSIGPKHTEIAIAVVMAVMLVVLLIRPQQWLQPKEQAPNTRRTVWVWLCFVAIGFYGGFIQAGVGVLLLVGLVALANLAPMHANSIKLLLALLFTVGALVVFGARGQVAWTVGLVVSVGQVVGAYVAARFLAESDRAGVWIRRALIAVVAASAVELLRRALM